MVKQILCALFALALAGCGGDSPIPNPFGGSSKPPAQPQYMPQPISGWAITQATDAGNRPDGTILPLKPLASPAFSFYQCANADICHISYVEMHTGMQLTGMSSLTLDYEIVGDNPVFNADRAAQPGCDEVPPSLVLIIHRAMDAGVAPAFNSYRWFSVVRTPLALGRQVITVPLSLPNWGGVMGERTDEAGFQAALGDQGSIGIGLGGHCAAAHGVAVSSGNAALIIHSYGAQ